MSRSYDGPSRVMMNRVKKQEEDERRHGREARTEAKQEDDDMEAKQEEEYDGPRSRVMMNGVRRNRTSISQ